MRVLLTIHHPLSTASGAPGAEIAVCNALRELGCEVEILSHDDLPSLMRRTFSIIAFPLLVLCWAILFCRRWEVVDYASFDGWLVSFLPKWLRPRLLAFHSHGLEHVLHDRFVEDCKRGAQRMSWKYPFYRGSLLLWKVARAARGADCCIFLNREELSFAVEKLGVDPHKAELTVNAIHPDLLTAASEIQLVNPGAAPLNVAYIGTYTQRKGIAYMMPALTRYIRSFPQAKVLLLGTGASEVQVHQDLPVECRGAVTVIPKFQRPDLPKLLSDFHVFLLPSLAEGFAISGLEAMVCGLVPIVTRGHGFEGYVSDGENGLLIDRASEEQILSSLLRLDRDREEWERLRLAARSTAQTFDWKRAARLRLEIYDRAMRRKVQPAVRVTKGVSV